MEIHPTPVASQAAVEASSRYVTRASGLVVPDTYASEAAGASGAVPWWGVAGRAAGLILYALVLMVVSAETGSIMSAFMCTGAVAGALLAQVDLVVRSRADRAIPHAKDGEVRRASAVVAEVVRIHEAAVRTG